MPMKTIAINRANELEIDEILQETIMSYDLDCCFERMPDLVEIITDAKRSLCQLLGDTKAGWAGAWVVSTPSWPEGFRSSVLAHRVTITFDGYGCAALQDIDIVKITKNAAGVDQLFFTEAQDRLAKKCLAAMYKIRK